MTWANAFDFGSQTVKVWAGGAGAWDWSGTLAKGGSASFADPLADGALLAVSVDGSGTVSLSTNAGSFSGRQATVVVGIPANATASRVVGVLADAASATAQQVDASNNQDGFPLAGGSASVVWTPNPADNSHWPLAFMGANVSTP
jgi:hypothetical protein